MVNMKQTVTKAIMKTKPFNWFLTKVFPKIRFSTYYTTMRGWKYLDGYKHLQLGDIIVTTDNKKASTVVIGGKWAHAGFCLGLNKNNDNYECAEMTSRNFTWSHFSDMCFEADHVAIYRCTDFDPEYINHMIDLCKSLKDAKYDNQFESVDKEFYCSELIYVIDFEQRLKLPTEILEATGEEYVSPTGLTLATNVYCVWDSDNSIAPEKK